MGFTVACVGFGGLNRWTLWGGRDEEGELMAERAVTAYRDDGAEDDQWGCVQYAE